MAEHATLFHWIIVMDVIDTFPPAKLIMGILSAPEYPPEEICDTVEHLFGAVDYHGDPMDFNFTDYYSREMGENLYRCFIAFRNLVCPSSLAGLKLRSNDAERRFMRNGSRRVNLDPGLLTLHSLILATTKNHSHRIPLSGGIYGEVTLLYGAGAFRDLPWTYPDYRTEAYKTDLLNIRNIFREQLKRERE